MDGGIFRNYIEFVRLLLIFLLFFNYLVYFTIILCLETEIYTDLTNNCK